MASTTRTPRTLGTIAAALALSLAALSTATARPGGDGGERTYDLTARAPVVGERFATDSWFELTDGQGTFGIRNEDIDIPMHVRGRVRHDERVERTVEAVASGLVTRMRRHTPREESVFDLEIAIGDERKTEKGSKTGDEQGQTVVSERGTDGWRHTVDGTAVAEHVAKRLTRELDTPDPLGRNGVRIGESWPLDAAALGLDPGEGELQTTGRGEVTLEKVAPCSQGGGTCAYLAMRARFEVRATGDVQVDGHIDLAGTIERELGTGFDRRMALQGPVSVSIRGEHEGVQVHGTMGGNLKVDVQQSRMAAPAKAAPAR